MNNNEIDICCVIETHLNCNVPSESVDIDGYALHRRDRSDGRQCGGVAAYARSDLLCTRLTDLETPLLETLWLLYRCNRMPRSVSHLLIGIVYHPPDAVHKLMSDHLIDAIDNVMKRHPNAGVVLLGDFNHLYDSQLRQYPLKQIVTSATRGSAILDKIYTNVADWYLPPIILPNTAGSDHNTVLAVPVNNNVKRGSLTTVVVRSNNTSSKNLLAHALKSVNWQPLYRMTDVESMTAFFYSTVTSLVDKYLPERVIVRHSTNKPWVTEEFCRLIRQRQHEWTSGNMTAYRLLRNRVNRLSYKLRRRFCQKRIDGLRRCNASNWWRETKRLTGQSIKTDLAGLAASECDGDNELLANRINESLQRVSADLNPLNTNTSTSCDSVPSQYTIYPEEVYSKLSRINPRKAPGPDDLPNWVLKEFAFTLCDPICCIFNTSVQSATVPAQWKSANVVPVPKVKPVCSIDNDIRPISLTPTLSKLLESFIGGWMLELIDDKFDTKQFGGLKGRSTTHALIDILHSWHTAVDEEKSARVVFIDYAKAFDHVDHSLVLQKMKSMEIPDFITQWIHSFLSDRKQRVKIGKQLSDWLQLSGGMPQGTWLGLYIFLILINDLATSDAQIHKFVDDVTMTEVLEKGKTSNMQQTLDQVQHWSSSNLMNINCKKTKEMLLGTINKNPPPILHLNDKSIDRVEAFKLLGLMVTDTLTWNDNTSLICSKASKRLHFLKLLKRSGMPTTDLVYYYTAVIRPVLEYCSVVWHASITDEQSRQIDSIQRRAVRIIGVSECANQLTPLKDRRNNQAMKFFDALLRPDNCLHDLIPSDRNRDAIDKLRHANRLPVPFARTERYKRSFLINALTNFQRCDNDSI